LESIANSLKNTISSGLVQLLRLDLCQPREKRRHNLSRLGADGRRDWLSGDGAGDGLTKAERQRRDFEAERSRWLEERRKDSGSAAQRATGVRLLSVFLFLFACILFFATRSRNRCTCVWQVVFQAL
jgi:hypothetical protein